VHPRWSECASRLGEELSRHGPGGYVGVREGEVHLTLSRAGLTESFNHYLEYGAIDQHVARALLDEERSGVSRPGRGAAIDIGGGPWAGRDCCGPPYFSVAMMRERDELPNIVKVLLRAFAFRLMRPVFQSRRLEFDCGMVFRSAVPAALGHCGGNAEDELSSPLRRLRRSQRYMLGKRHPPRCATMGGQPQDRNPFGCGWDARGSVNRPGTTAPCNGHDLRRPRSLRSRGWHQL
jgi:hypothetical protein